MNFVITPASIDDVGTVIQLNHKLFLSDREYDQLLEIKWHESKSCLDYFTHVITKDDGICLLAKADNHVLGYIAGGIHSNELDYRLVKRAELANTYVEEAFRGQGIGTALANKFFLLAKAKGADKCYVQAYSGNTNAISLYEELGFNKLFVELEQDIDALIKD